MGRLGAARGSGAGVSAAPATRSRALDTALTSVSQLAVLAGAALLGVLIAARFGATARTDGFFAANSLYGMVLFVAQSVRTTAVARLVGERTVERFACSLGAMAWIALGWALVVVLATLALAPLALDEGSLASFRTTIVVLWPAAAMQLFTGLGAAALAALDDYRIAAVAYSCGAAVSVLAFVVLAPGLGVNGVAWALVAGAATAAGVVGAGLMRRGWRPRPPVLGRAARAETGRVLLGAIALVAAQGILVASVALATRTGTGAATIYSYAAMLVMALSAGLVSPIGVVFAPVVARDWDRRASSLVGLALRAFRIGALLTVPAVAFVALLGPAPAKAVLHSVSDADVDRIFATFLVLAPSLLGSLLAMIPLVAVLTEQRFRVLAAWSAGVAAAHIAASVAVVALGGGLIALAVVATASSFGLSFVAVRLGMRGSAGALLASAAGTGAAIVLPGLVAFGAPAIALAGGGFVPALVAWAIGGTAYLAWLLWRAPGELAELRGIVRARGGA